MIATSLTRVLVAIALSLAVNCDALATDAAAGPAPKQKPATQPINITVPDSMRVSIDRAVPVMLPPDAARSERDWFDWLGLIGTLVVAPLFALLAAQVGARIGGVEARRSAVEVQEREALDARRLRSEERRENEVRERALLLRRFERDLTTAGGIADGLRAAQQITPVMPVSAANLRAMWDSFVRRRDAVMLLADPDLEHEIEFFYEWAFSRSAFLEAWLENERALLSFANPDEVEIHRRAEVGEQDVRTHVERGRSVLPRLRARIEERVAQR